MGMKMAEKLCERERIWIWVHQLFISRSLRELSRNNVFKDVMSRHLAIYQFIFFNDYQKLSFIGYIKTVGQNYQRDSTELAEPW